MQYFLCLLISDPGNIFNLPETLLIPVFFRPYEDNYTAVYFLLYADQINVRNKTPS